MKLLHALREKSDSTKKNVAALSSGLITGVIAIVWISTLPARLSTPVATEEDNSVVVPTQESPSSFSELITTVKDQTAAIVEAVPEPEPEPQIESEPEPPKSVRVKSIERTQTSQNRVIRIATTSPQTVENEE